LLLGPSLLQGVPDLLDHLVERAGKSADLVAAALDGCLQVARRHLLGRLVETGREKELHENTPPKSPLDGVQGRS